jgi:DNA polymerase-3 subunit gamma/tau
LSKRTTVRCLHPGRVFFFFYTGWARCEHDLPLVKSLANLEIKGSSTALDFMTYQVIARKWRPQTFADVTGQEAITQTLRNAIAHGRLHHAYLFSGARGVGKTTTARLLAKALNCHKATGPTPEPCAIDDPTACPSCREIAAGGSIDVQEIDAASNTDVGNIRDAIIGTVAFAPARDRYKVFIIDEVHMLSGHSFNALLKTIEEPPPRVVFIMATTSRHKVPETILSRCQLFEFRTIATAKIADRLRYIADAEGLKIPDEAIREIARAGEGSMRDAQSAFDQVISFAGNEIKTEDVEKALGIAGAEILARVVSGIAANNSAEALAVVDEIVMRGHDLRNFCRDLLAYFRDLMVVKVSGDARLLETSVASAGELQRHAELFSESDLVRFFNSLAETETNLKEAAHPRYQVEVGLVKLMEMRRLAPLTELVARVAALEESLRTGKPVSAKTSPEGGPGSPNPNASGKQTTSSSRSAGGGGRAMAEEARAVKASVPHSSGTAAAAPALERETMKDVAPGATAFQPPAATEPETGAFAAASSKPTADLSPVDQIRAGLEAKRRMRLLAALDGALSVSFAGDELCAEFAPEAKHFRDTFDKANSKMLQDLCREVLGRDISLRFVIKSADAGATLSSEDEARREQQQLRQTAEQHPAVQQVLRTFRGEIVDVKRLRSE